jgi:hypothetical protein
MKLFSHLPEFFNAITTRAEEKYHVKNSPKKEVTKIA